MARKSRIDELLERQARELEQLQSDEIRRVLEAYEDARRSLRGRLADIDPVETPATAQRLRVTLVQVEEGVALLQRAMGQALQGAELRTHRQAVKHLLGLIKAAEPEFRDMGGLLEVDLVERLSRQRGLALHKYSVQRYGAQVVEAIQRELVAGVAQGMTQAELAARVAAAGGSVLSGFKGRAELIARMETARAYNDGYLESIKEMDARDPRDLDPMLKKIDEFFDARNHPFSRAAHGVTARPSDNLKVPTEAVAIAGAELKKGTGGVLWPKVGPYFMGQNLPAHFNDRGRIIAWRESWSAAGERLVPSLEPDPTAEPRGRPEREPRDPSTRESIRLQNETIRLFRRQLGYDMEFTPSGRRPTLGKKADSRMEGERFEVFALTSKDPMAAVGRLREKMAAKQARRFAINLDHPETTITIEQVQEFVVGAVEAYGVLELFAVKGGRIVRVLG